MSKVKYQRERLASVKDDILPLLKQDWDEIQHDKDKIPLDPNWELYQAVEDATVLRIYTARTQEDKLVGYIVFILTPSMHSRSLTLAVCDILFLTKSRRKGMTGVRLMRFAEQEMIAEGVRWFQITTTESHPIDPVMKRLGYRKTETRHEKVI